MKPRQPEICELSKFACSFQGFSRLPCTLFPLSHLRVFMVWEQFPLFQGIEKVLLERILHFPSVLEVQYFCTRKMNLPPLLLSYLPS